MRTGRVRMLALVGVLVLALAFLGGCKKKQEVRMEPGPVGAMGPPATGGGTAPTQPPGAVQPPSAEPGR